ncbi:major facilitator superfamily domain-containing protein [Dunaliella salina]|uniref:Major facilitator superfamily domain-containing protein n=1 Tax=Dunaliella salina TaxID=3046 RepID=A0ABQ7H0H3_DUNSA|nr:major facilitator superfamily domain-containing protein [Dunaliella salina]|eukprot:KAF5840351.1 major facilitator superfamily domain-containing protein [Dunaliella salina]
MFDGLPMREVSRGMGPQVTVDPGTVFRKCHINILLLFAGICAMCYLDRTNLAFASMQLTKDLNFTAETYGLGAGLFYLGYSLSMIPSQLMLMKLGANVWLGIIVMAWGACATAFCVLSSITQFYVLRFLLGVAESGAFPGMWFQLYQFYPLHDITVPFSVLEVAVNVANVLAAPLAGLLLMLDGIAGLRGWQWLFVAEGAPSIALGLLTFLLLPNTVQRAEWLTSAEKKWLASKVEMSKSDQMSVADALSNRTLIWDAITSMRVWWMTGMALLKNIASNAVIFWCPIIVHALMNKEKELNNAAQAVQEAGAGAHHTTNVWVGGDKDGASNQQARRAVMLTALPFAGAALFALWLGHRSQKCNERSLHLAMPYFVASILFASLPRLAAISTVWSFVALCIVVACVQGSNSIINSFIPLVSNNSQCVPVSMALYNSVANLGGLIGPWLVGEVVHRSGSYDDALKFLGVVMGVSAAMAFATRSWDQKSAALGEKVKRAMDNANQDSFTHMLDESLEL